MGTFSDGSQAVQGWNSQRCCEVTVGSAADCGLKKGKAKLQREFPGVLVESDHCRRALEWSTIQSAGDFQFAAAVPRPKRTELPLETRRFFLAGHTYIDFCFRELGNNIGASAAANDPGVHGGATLQVGKSGNLGELTREFG